MGTLNFTVTSYAKAEGRGFPSLTSTEVKTSGAHSTNATSATNVEDGTGDISLSPGDVVKMHGSEAMWVSFGGTTAAVGTGFYLPSGETVTVECRSDETGAVSAIDTA